MFGHNERLERKLKEQGGRQAWATVLESKEEWTSSGGVNKAPGQAGSFTTHQELKLRVEPDGESPFETTVKQVFHDTHGWPIPKRGDSVMVIYDPDDRSKLVIDVDKPPIGPGVDRDEAMARHERAMQHAIELERTRQVAADAAVAGTATAAPRGTAAAAPRDPAGAAEQIRAVAHDPSLSPEEKRARIMQLSTGMGAGAKTMFVGGQIVQSAPTDVVDTLAKLADLRDRGALTGEEFEAQKRKLLGQ